MKIAFVVHDFLGGVGHGRYCIELARQLSKEHEIHILANRFSPKLNFEYTPHFVNAWRATALTSVLTFPKAAQRILDRNRFDVIHAQGYSCRRADVITAHVCNSARYRRSPPSSLRKKIFPRFVIPRERAFYQNSGAREIIAISKVVQRELHAEYQRDSTVIYHGVDSQEFRPSTESPAPIDRWLFVGEAVKGLSQAISALVDFPTATLAVVSRSHLDPWKALADKLRVRPRVEFLGPLDAISDAYRKAGLFIYASDYDAFGMVVAEAMSSGLIVVAGQAIGAAEWIQPGANGYICDPGDPASLREQLLAIQRLSPPEISAVRDAARRTACARTWERCCKETLHVYDRAISSKRTTQ